MADDAELISVYITGPSAEVVTKIARAVVDSRLAGCVNITPGVTSVYRWNAAVETDQETLAVVHTRRALFDELAEKVRELHPDAVPQLIAVPLVESDPAYAEWLLEATQR